jgi:hypothetical protein
LKLKKTEKYKKTEARAEEVKSREEMYEGRQQETNPYGKQMR